MYMYVLMYGDELRKLIKPSLLHYLPQCKSHHQLLLFLSGDFHILMDPAAINGTKLMIQDLCNLEI